MTDLAYIPDRAALTAGFALLADDGTITFPELPNAR